MWNGYMQLNRIKLDIEAENLDAVEYIPVEI